MKRVYCSKVYNAFLIETLLTLYFGISDEASERKWQTIEESINAKNECAETAYLGIEWFQRNCHSFGKQNSHMEHFQKRFRSRKIYQEFRVWRNQPPMHWAITNQKIWTLFLLSIFGGEGGALNGENQSPF